MTFNVNYLNSRAFINSVRFSAMKHHLNPLYITGLINSNMAVVSSRTNLKKYSKFDCCTIDSPHELRKQDRHVTCYKIEASLDSMTSTRKILDEHLATKNISACWILHNWTITLKTNKCILMYWCKEIIEKYNRGVSNAV